jgi:hypothetical protein
VSLRAALAGGEVVTELDREPLNGEFMSETTNESKPLRYTVKDGTMLLSYGERIGSGWTRAGTQVLCDRLNEHAALLAEKESLSQELFCLRALSDEALKQERFSVSLLRKVLDFAKGTLNEVAECHKCYDCKRSAEAVLRGIPLELEKKA